MKVTPKLNSDISHMWYKVHPIPIFLMKHELYNGIHGELIY